MLSLAINDDVSIVDGILSLCGEQQKRFLLEKEIGRGANGIVFRAMRTALMQPCALKLWVSLRSNDSRDKVQQGIAEARKIAAAHPDWVPTIYDADTIGDVFFTSMEYIPGLSLKQHLNAGANLRDRWMLARLYINAIEKTTTEASAHGDAHWGNVVVYDDHVDPHEPKRRLKLIDFGTSLFTGQHASRARHWKVVDETFRRILADFGELPYALKAQGAAFGEPANRPEHLKIPYYDDVLNQLKVEAKIFF